MLRSRADDMTSELRLLQSQLDETHESKLSLQKRLDTVNSLPTVTSTETLDDSSETSKSDERIELLRSQVRHL